MVLVQSQDGPAYNLEFSLSERKRSALHLRCRLSLIGLFIAITLNGCVGGTTNPQINSITFASNAQGTDIVCTASASGVAASGSPLCTTSLLPTVIIGGSSIYIFANVETDNELLGVTWTVTCGSSGSASLQSVNTACGTFTPVQTQSGPVPLYQTTGIVTTYSGPSAVPKGGTVTITASATSQPTEAFSVTLPVATGGQSQIERPAANESRTDWQRDTRMASKTKPANGNSAGSGI